MAWRLDKSVVRGEIDNRVRGCVTGRIWLTSIEDPIQLKLEGNCWRDMAGCLLTFENPKAAPNTSENVNLHPEQKGIVGDMTASRKVRVYDIPVKDAYMMRKRGEIPPEHMANCLYLEWHSQRNGRVVIESTDYICQLSDPLWRMTPEEEIEQGRKNANAMTTWMDRLVEAAAQAHENHTDTPKRPDMAEPMDEFDCERLLKYSDARCDQMMEIEEKYRDLDPETRMTLITEEMGWGDIHRRARQAQDKAHDEDTDWEEAEDYDDLYQTNPLTEGEDWIRTEDGEIVHPLQHRCFELVIAMYHDCKEALERDAEPDSPLHNMLFCFQQISVKLAGALHGMIYENGYKDYPMAVAMLKRTLSYFNEGIEHSQTVRQKGMIPEEQLERFLRDMYTIREEILRLMEKYREQGPS